jgi:hypothetical protein
MALSLTFLGLAYLLLSRQDGIVLRPFTRLGIVVSATFCAVAATVLATLGGALATALFVLSRMRNES